MQAEESNELHPAEQGTRARTILVVEDDADIREFIGALISTIPFYHYFRVPDAFQAIEFTKGIKPDLLIVDYRLTGMNGFSRIVSWRCSMSGLSSSSLVAVIRRAGIASSPGVACNRS